MLYTSSYFDQAVNNFLDAPHKKAITDHHLQAMEWEVLQDLELILEVRTISDMLNDSSPICAWY